MPFILSSDFVQFLVVDSKSFFVLFISVEAAALKSRGVNILIALGHSGYDVDQQIARLCPDIDIVVGGHSNTFLYNGVQPDAENIIGPYPTVVTQKSGKKVPVVQAFAYTKYLGHLKLNVSFMYISNMVSISSALQLVTAMYTQCARNDTPAVYTVTVYRHE